MFLRFRFFFELCLYVFVNSFTSLVDIFFINFIVKQLDFIQYIVRQILIKFVIFSLSLSISILSFFTSIALSLLLSLLSHKKELETLNIQVIKQNVKERRCERVFLAIKIHFILRFFSIVYIILLKIVNIVLLKIIWFRFAIFRRTCFKTIRVNWLLKIYTRLTSI